MYTSNSICFKQIFSLCALYGVMAFASACFAQDQFDSPDMLDMSIEQLMEADVVVSASRQARQVSKLSVPASVITAEDIHYSGLTKIPEILMLAPGVDVQKIDQKRYAISVRGFQGQYSDRILVLINGRSAGNPVLAGINWESFPVLIEDIERIEIIRGPIGAAWGANAENGLVNIITKKPVATQGWFASTTIDEYGGSYTHARYAEKSDLWSWRLSAGYEDVQSSNNAGAGRMTSGVPSLNSTMGYSRFSSRDYARDWIFDFQADRILSEKDEFSFGFAHSNLILGNTEYVGQFPGADLWSEYSRVFTRIDRNFDDGSTGYIQWFSNHYVAKNNWLSKYSFLENDIEAQYNLASIDGHTVSVGGNLRWTHINISNGKASYEMNFEGAPYDEYWVGFFLSDTYEMTDRLTFENQIRSDWYSETDMDWSLRSSLLYDLDENDKHVLRFSFARAFRNPSAVLRKASATYLNGLFNTFRPQDDLVNEESWSLEAGYTGQFTNEFSLGLNTYYQRYENILGVKNRYVVAWPAVITNSTFSNNGGATACGAELEVTYKTKKQHTSAWYACNALSTDKYEDILRAGYPAHNKAGLTTRWFLPENFVFNANYIYYDSIIQHGDIVLNAPVNHRFDLSLSKQFNSGNGEIMLGLLDVLNQTSGPNFDVGKFTAHETPGRTFFVRAQYKF